MSSALHIFAATDHSPQGNFAVARAFVRISEHCDRPFRLIVTGHFANA